MSDPNPSEPLMTANQVREFFGGISEMTLWRWLHDASLNFPRPILIRKRRLWQQSEILDFAARQQQLAA